MEQAPNEGDKTVARLIGICGFARSGKDTAASMLMMRGFTRIAFADVLKDEVCRTFGLTREGLERDKEMWRPLLVEWGRGRRRGRPAQGRPRNPEGMRLDRSHPPRRSGRHHRRIAQG